ncbi:MAG: hypothetical protein OEZ06_24725 [Myxococcales bacterium]|nr:hypothetical protein [Myxococcales bacterium]
MSASYRREGSSEEEHFLEAEAQFASMKKALMSSELEAKSEAEIERWLSHEQRELMRRLHQAYLALRSQARPTQPVVGADARERTHERGAMVRKLETLFGTVELGRTGYCGRGLSYLFPVDAALGLGSTRYSLEVNRQVALGASRMSFDATLEMMAEHHAAHVPKRQAEQSVKRSAPDFDAFYDNTRLHFPGPTSPLLVLTFDQKGVVLRHEDLTDATRKAAREASPMMDSRRSKGEVKRGRKRRASVAAVYTVAPHERTADEVIAGLRRVRDASTKPKPRPEAKRVWASLQRSLEDVISDAFR